MNKHTPGPWEAKEFTCHAKTTVIAADGTPVAETTGFGRAADDCLADARLIASAPNMAKTLQRAAHLLAEITPSLSGDDRLLIEALRGQIIENILEATPEYYGRAA